jgi:ribonuclease T2
LISSQAELPGKAVRAARAAFLLAAMAAAVPVSAQSLQCHLPTQIARPHVEGPTSAEPRRIMGIAGYTLAVIWVPQACRSSRLLDPAMACSAANVFGFVLHGLWPDGEGGSWPQYCAPSRQLDEEVVRQNLCVTPSAQLLQHEYAKHGTCTGLAPRRFFARSAALFARLRFPDMAALSRRRGLTAGQFAIAFAAANRGMRADMLRLNLGPAGELEEVWLCLDRGLRLRTCPSNQAGPGQSTAISIAPPRPTRSRR